MIHGEEDEGDDRGLQQLQREQEVRQDETKGRADGDEEEEEEGW